MKRSILLFAAIVFVSGNVAVAGDAWKDKAYQDWTKKDVQKILNDSPWAQSTEIADQDATTLDALDAGAHGVGGGVGEDGGAKGVGPRKKYIVRWSSSRTVREALFRNDQFNGNKTDAAGDGLSKTPDHYELTLLGTDLSDFEGANLEALKKTVYVQLKTSHRKIFPAGLAFVKDSFGRSVLLAQFARNADNSEATIGPGEKGVDFIAVAGKTRLKFHFDLDKMTDKQGLDL